MSGLSSGNWLVDSLVAVTLLIALVLLTRGPVARLFGPRIAYALWAIPAARALLPQITLTVDAPLPMAGDLVVVPTLPAGLAVVTPPAAFDPTALLCAVWATGALLLALWSIASYARLRRAINADASLLDMHGRIAILSSGAVDGPVALGLWRPQVVLPRDFAARFTADQQAYVLAHELAHHRGGDLVANIAAFALLCVNWFNPLAWLGWRAFRSDQEAACDARVLISGTVARADYGRAIVHAVTGTAFHPAHALALPMASRSALVHRLRSLAMPDISPRRARIGRAAIATAALLALPLTASVSYAVQAEPPAPPAAPAAPNVIVSADNAPHERRIERDGRTIILRTTQPLSDAEVERLVAQAESAVPEAERNAAANADATARRDVTRIVIRTHGQADPAMPVPPVPPSDGERRTERRFVFVNQGEDAMRCADEADQRSGDSRQVRVVSCMDGSAADRLSRVRGARAAMAQMTDAQIPAEARRSALAELDGLIAELERESAN